MAFSRETNKDFSKKSATREPRKTNGEKNYLFCISKNIFQQGFIILPVNVWKLLERE